MLEDDHKLIMSPLSQSYEANGKSVQIDIYTGDDGGWIVEVIDQYDNSTIWEDEFLTEKEALNEAIAAIVKEGISTFIAVK